MTFWKRLRTYLIGVGLGLLMVYVFFKDRDLGGWTPQGRVLTTIDSSAVTLSDRALCQLNCYQIPKEEWRMIHNVADVNFSESNVRKKPCPVYRLESNYREEDYILIWEVCENAEKVELLSVKKLGIPCKECG
ncbi:MAG: hypothetical protein JKY48_07940 [Flavobacteriales bacterium]|nr:hypothetical protein [Flavobacteriales bacterium]